MAHYTRPKDYQRKLKDKISLAMAEDLQLLAATLALQRTKLSQTITQQTSVNSEPFNRTYC